jgi:hypothetical protein
LSRELLQQVHDLILTVRGPGTHIPHIFSLNSGTRFGKRVNVAVGALELAGADVAA